MKYLLILTILILNCCNCTKEMTKTDCADKNSAIKVSNTLLEKEGLDINKLNIEVTEKSNQYLINYTPKDTLTLGNGAEIIIDKNNCDIISKKIYQ
jgi:hypothetical protein